MAGPGRVLYVTYDGILEPLGASQVLPYVRRLAAAGVEMDILSFEKPGDLASAPRVGALAASLARDGVGWTRLVYHKRPSLPATAWDVLQGSRQVARWARRVRSGGGEGLLHARGYLPGLMGLWGRGPAGPPLLFDMRGFWVDERIEGGYWAPDSVPVRLGRAVERRLLRDADHLVLLTHRAAGRLHGLSGRGEVPPWTVVPTCVDLERFAPPDDPWAARRALGIDEGPVLVHVGTLTGWYDGAGTMAVARAFLERTKGTFVVLTREPAHARRLAAESGVEARIATASPEEVPRWLQAADAGLALVRPSPSKDASFPTKVGEYLAVGLAVLATPVGDMEQVESPDVLRLMREGDDPGDAAAWLAGAAARADRAPLARALAERVLSLERGVEALLDVYASLGVHPAGAREGGP